MNSLTSTNIDKLIILNGSADKKKKEMPVGKLEIQNLTREVVPWCDADTVILNRISNLKEEVYLRFGKSVQVSNLSDLQNLLPPGMVTKLENAVRNIQINCVFSVALRGVVETLEGRYPRCFDDMERSLATITDSAISMLTAWFNQQLLDANVKSSDQIITKSAAIIRYKEIAERVYLSRLENLNRRLQIERSFWEGVELPENEYAAVVRYFDSVVIVDGWKAQLANEQLTKKVISICVTEFEKLKDKFEKDEDARVRNNHNDPRFKYKVEDDIAGRLLDRVYATAVGISNDIERESESTSLRGNLFAEYFKLKIKLVIHSFFNKKVRECIAKLRLKYAALVKLVNDLSFRESIIDELRENVKFYRDCVKLYENRYAKDKNEAWLKNAEIDRRKAEEAQEKLIKKTNKYLGKTPWQLAFKSTGVLPETFDRVANKCAETPFERSFMQYCNIAYGPEFIDPHLRMRLNVDRDINVDLDNIKDPISFFVDLFAQQDIERLSPANILQIEEVHESSAAIRKERAQARDCSFERSLFMFNQQG